MYNFNMDKKILIILLLICSSNLYCQNYKTITIPEIEIPEIYLPAIYVPARVIPGFVTKNGIVIDEIYIPEINLPAVLIPKASTKARTIIIPDYSVITREQVEKYLRLYDKNVQRLKPLSYQYMSAQERNEAFQIVSPYADSFILKIFSSADIDNSGTLSLNELIYFQNLISKNYSYQNNNIALRPDAFLKNGGGDCEDWALLTAAFCLYWGWDAYIGCFYGDSNIGHALCLVKYPFNVPKDFISWKIDKSETAEGDIIQNGNYIPVDYNYVGSFSNAIQAGMKLKYVCTPEKMYNLPF